MARLDETDGTILRRLSDGPVRFHCLAEDVGTDGCALRERVARLRDVGLVAVDVDPDSVVSLTRDGRRVLAAPGTGSADDRIDTSPAVERAIEDLELAPDAAAAVRAAYVFLGFWGDATAAEVGDALYAEHPAGYDDAGTWWDELVRDGLAHLPDVRAPDDDHRFRFTGEAESTTVEDGRHVVGPVAVGSVRHAVDHLGGRPEERWAVRAAFAALYEAGELTVHEFTDTVYPDHPAGYDTAAAWWAECVLPGLESLPHVHPDPAGETWRYARRPTDGV